MRFRFSKAKSESLRRNPKRGIGFEEAQEAFLRPYYQDQRSDDPEQYRAIGWVQDRLFTVVFEIRGRQARPILPPCDAVAVDAGGTGVI